MPLNYAKQLASLKSEIERSIKEREVGKNRGHDARAVLGSAAITAWRVAEATQQVRDQRNEERLIRRQHPIGSDEWAIYCPCGIGDTFFACGLAQAVLKKHGGHSMVAFVKPQHEFIPSLFPSINRSFVVPSGLRLEKLGSPKLRRGSLFRAYFSLHLANMVGYKSITLLDCYRSLFDLSPDARLETPRPPSPAELQKASDDLKARGATPGRTAILCPDAVSTSQLYTISSAFWERLASQLSRAGWSVMTNLGPGTQCISGTIGVQLPLRDVRAYVTAAGAVVSNRSGLCDLICDLDIALSVLYPAGRWYGGPLLQSSGLRAMGISQSAQEMEISGENEAELVSTIASHLLSPSAG